ncbi:hypothetical protein BDN72DRAFT_846858 [Pluteus cervinus]|uniref:Uncharacterized protein n=1 Tax=Pluteus cervinus TaxID=181527 RepID=A0ACD3AE28_9AGAR|nr:hypothetical protein BDN72DRAFT_846858 [Pluteus cervinus]
MSTGNRDELRKKIDEEIAALFERIRSLSTDRNTLAPVNSLPPEVLGRAFILVRDSSLENTRAGSSKKYLNWLQVTQVSQRWRDVAIGYPDLWTKLPLHNEQCLKLFLNRSRNSPLSIVIPLSKTNISSFHFILQSSSPVRSLSLGTSSQDWNQTISHLRFPAPELKEFRLVSNSTGNKDISWPQDLFGGNAPQLRRLTVSGFPFRGYLPAFHGVTLLCLDGPVIRTPLPILLNTLRQMFSLRSLTVKDHHEQDKSNDDTNLTGLSLPIIMPHLKEVTIHSPVFERIFVFFDSLRFLKSPTFEFRWIVASSAITTIPDSYSRLLQVLQTSYQSGMTPFSRLRIGATSNDFQLVGWDITNHITCHIKMLYSRQPYFPGWFYACDQLPLTQLDSLEVYGADSLDFFKQFNDLGLTRLKSISVEDDDGLHLVRFLLQNFEKHRTTTKGPMLTADKDNQDLPVYADTCCKGESWDIDEVAFPALEVIIMPYFPYNSVSHPLWVNALKMRKRHGFGPNRIVLEKCRGVTAEMVEELQAVVEVRRDEW